MNVTHNATSILLWIIKKFQFLKLKHECVLFLSESFKLNF